MNYRIEPISGYQGYFVSINGEVFSIRKGTWYKLKPQPDHDGYLHVLINSKPGARRQTLKVQRLMALVFMGPKPNGMVVCHNNGVLTDNRLSNLRYDTHKNNVLDTKKHGHENPPRGSVNGMSKLTTEQVLEIRRLRREEGVTHSKLGEQFGVSREQARDICNRKFWRHV